MRATSGTAVLVLGLASLAACGHRAARGAEATAVPEAPDSLLSPDERARNDCRTSFSLCAPPANYPPDLAVDELSVRSLVQISWRLDLSDTLSEKAAKRLRVLAQRGDLATVREIAAAADVAAATLGRCRCKGDQFRPEYDKQAIAEIVAGRLPPAELRDPSHWATRIAAQLSALRALSRHSAEALSVGDASGGAEVDARVQAEERSLCETVQAARDVLPEGQLEELHALVRTALARETGEASAEVARRTLERLERRTSCASDERAVTDPD